MFFIITFKRKSPYVPIFVDPYGGACWAVDGIAVSSAVGAQGMAQLVPNGDGGAIIAWEDERDGGSADEERVRPR